MHICLFDIDGTLILTGGAGQSAFAHTLTRDFGIPEINRDVVFAGRSDRAIAMEFFRVHEISPTEENWRRFCRGYVESLDQMLPTHEGNVLPGVHSLVKSLQSRGDVAIGLLTGNIRDGARRKLSFYGLWEHFPFGGFGDEHEDRNEIAAAALSVARDHVQSNGRYGSSAGSEGQVIVIGDTLHDVRCGQSIGARCVAVATGHSTSDVLRTGQPDVVVESLEDRDRILALLDG
jgi:phosphoglycolate phosphatase-like HAD superfamily hydrolase